MGITARQPRYTNGISTLYYHTTVTIIIILLLSFLSVIIIVIVYNEMLCEMFDINEEGFGLVICAFHYDSLWCHFTSKFYFPPFFPTYIIPVMFLLACLYY